MIILDFLFYYLTYWFDNNKDKLSWSTPLQRSSYALGLGTIALIYSITQIIEITKSNNTDFHFPKLLFLLLGLGIMWLYDYIYIKKNRYGLITPMFDRFPNKDNSVTISIIVVAVCILSPFIVTTIFVPFGGHPISKK
ncbi:hypothetical protein [Mucilaginibacter sp. NFX135]|uniref:hypothetical protein n=1 Tax=Mucilaginibacter sp. NFX135 TaxID=3402687 RepID=UPI003AFA5BCA